VALAEMANEICGGTDGAPGPVAARSCASPFRYAARIFYAKAAKETKPGTFALLATLV
jgi:hypothetical protein